MLRPTWSGNIPDANDLILGRERDLAVPPAGSVRPAPLPAVPPGTAGRGPGTVSRSGCGARLAVYPPRAAAPPPAGWLPWLPRVLSDAVESVPRLTWLELPSLGRDFMVTGTAGGRQRRPGGGAGDGGGVLSSGERDPESGGTPARGEKSGGGSSDSCGDPDEGPGHCRVRNDGGTAASSSCDETGVT